MISAHIMWLQYIILNSQNCIGIRYGVVIPTAKWKIRVSYDIRYPTAAVTIYSYTVLQWSLVGDQLAVVNYVNNAVNLTVIRIHCVWGVRRFALQWYLYFFHLREITLNFTIILLHKRWTLLTNYTNNTNLNNVTRLLFGFRDPWKLLEKIKYVKANRRSEY